jgi:aminotransferase EvaB
MHLMTATPFFRLPSNDKLENQIFDAVNRVLLSKWYVLGNEVSEFENQFASFCGVRHCVSVANGTDALEIALRAMDIGSGDRILLAANAGFYGSTAAYLVGAVPIYVDVSSTTLTLSPEQIKKDLYENPKPKAVIVTHLYGQLADIEAIVNLANEAGVPVIEDCAQAHGASNNSHQAGSFGTVGCFSFYPTKNLGALGDGGAIVTDDNDIYIKLKQLRQYGWSEKYNSTLPGGRNSRLDEIQAAVLRVKLPYLSAWNQERREIARRYNKAFVDLPVQCPMAISEEYVAHLYVLRVENRDAFRLFLTQHGIATDIHYPIPDHMQTAYPCLQARGDLPVTEAACATAVSLPCFPGLQEDEIETIIRIVRHFFDKVGA